MFATRTFRAYLMHARRQWAALSGHAEMVTALLDNGAAADLANNNGNTPLQCAASGGHVAAVTALLGKGAAINLADNDGDTPLHGAAESGHVEVVTALLGKGAAVDLANTNGATPLSAAEQQGRDEVVAASMIAKIKMLVGDEPYSDAELTCSEPIYGKFAQLADRPARRRRIGGVK